MGVLLLVFLFYCTFCQNDRPAHLPSHGAWNNPVSLTELQQIQFCNKAISFI